MVQSLSLILALGYMAWGGNLADRAWATEDAEQRVSMQISALALMLGGAALAVVCCP